MIPLKAVDVAIGVVFFYLLVTFCASALLELISTTLNWRALMLHDAIENMLEKSFLVTTDDIYNNPQVVALFRREAAESRVDLFESFGWHIPGDPELGASPSYIPAATFSGAVLQGLMDRALSWKVVQTLDFSPVGAVNLISALLNAPLPPGCACATKSIKEDALRSILETTLATQGQSIQALRFGIEKWFNDTMDRTSGWYKRRSQACLLIIGMILAFACNLNTIAVARWLWHDDASRQAAITAASTYVQQHPVEKDKDPNTKAPPLSDAAASGANIVAADYQISALHYPVGWYGVLRTDISVYWILSYVFGALITALAISMGSTFWFDAVQNLLKIRGTGPKPGAR
jgi:hypothetical protein